MHVVLQLRVCTPSPAKNFRITPLDYTHGIALKYCLPEIKHRRDDVSETKTVIPESLINLLVPMLT